MNTKPLPPALSEYKLKLIQYSVFPNGGKGWGGDQKCYFLGGGDGGIFLPGEENKKYEIRTKMEQEQ